MKSLCFNNFVNNLSKSFISIINVYFIKEIISIKTISIKIAFTLVKKYPNHVSPKTTWNTDLRNCDFLSLSKI